MLKRLGLWFPAHTCSGLRQCLLFGEGEGRSRLDPGGGQANHVIKKLGSQNLDLQTRPLISHQPKSKWHSTSVRREGSLQILETNCHYWLYEDPVVNTCHPSHFWSVNLRYQIVPSCFKFSKMPLRPLFLGGSISFLNIAAYVAPSLGRGLRVACVCDGQLILKRLHPAGCWLVFIHFPFPFPHYQKGSPPPRGGYFLLLQETLIWWLLRKHKEVCSKLKLKYS